MRKRICMVMVCMTAVLPCLHAQMVAVLEPIATGLITKMGADQLVYYGQAISAGNLSFIYSDTAPACWYVVRLAGGGGRPAKPALSIHV